MNVTFVDYHEAPKSVRKYMAVNGVDYPVLRLHSTYTDEAKQAFVVQGGAPAWADTRLAAMRQACEKEFGAVVQAQTAHMSSSERENAMTNLCLFVIIFPLLPSPIDPSIHGERYVLVPWLTDLPFPKAGEKLPAQIASDGAMVAIVNHEVSEPNKIAGVFVTPQKTANGNLYPQDLWKNAVLPTAVEYTGADYSAVELQIMQKLKESGSVPKDVKGYYGVPVHGEAQKVVKEIHKAVNFATHYGLSTPQIKKLLADKFGEKSAGTAALEAGPHSFPFLTQSADDAQENLRKNLARYGFKIAGKV